VRPGEYLRFRNGLEGGYFAVTGMAGWVVSREQYHLNRARQKRMFGIGLPEFILIMAVALIVVGPEKLPELAKTVAKQVLELKKAANALKESFQEEASDKPWERSSHDVPHLPAGEDAEQGADVSPSGAPPRPTQSTSPDEGVAGEKTEGSGPTRSGSADQDAAEP